MELKNKEIKLNNYQYESLKEWLQDTDIIFDYSELRCFLKKLGIREKYSEYKITNCWWSNPDLKDANYLEINCKKSYLKNSINDFYLTFEKEEAKND